MGKYIKVFENHSDYTDFKQSADYMEPNVSVCTQEEDVHYNPLVIAQPLIATYNVEDASNSTLLFVGAESMGFSASAIYDKIEIDNVEINMSDLSSSEEEGMTFYSYQLTSGEHTVKYTLKDPTMIGAEVDEETHMPSKFGATFAGCRNIVSVEIPNTVLIIGRVAFQNCDGLSSLEIPNNVTSIEDGAFNSCSGLTSVTIPNSVTSIGIAAFQFCRNLTSVTIPSSVTTIGENAFYECRNLTSVTISNGVTSIGNNAFNHCDGLTSVTIPSSVTTIGGISFDVLRLVVIYATTPPSRNIFFKPVFDGNDILTVIQVPSEAVNTYKATWSGYAEIIEAIPTTSVITFTIDNVQKQADLQTQWWNQWVNTDNRFIVDSLNERSCVKDTQTGYWVSTTSDSSGVISAYDQIISNGQYHTVEVTIK